MKKIVAAALLSLVTGSTSLLFPQAAKADRVIYCHPVTDNRVLKDSADNARAYADGYREGEQSARNREPYKPRTAGGEFARGFEDGYFNLFRGIPHPLIGWGWIAAQNNATNQ